MVLANGEILNLQSEMRKDNTGFDLKQLFIVAIIIKSLFFKFNYL